MKTNSPVVNRMRIWNDFGGAGGDELLYLAPHRGSVFLHSEHSAEESLYLQYKRNYKRTCEKTGLLSLGAT
jgi:hypothetical protein